MSSGGSVSKWMDESGNGNDASQTVSANQPTWMSTGFSSTIPTVHFNGTAVSYLTAPSTALSPSQITIIAVAKKTGTATYGPLASLENSGTGPYYLSLSSTAATFALTNGTTTVTGPYSGGSFSVIEGDYDQTSARIYINNLLKGTTAYTTALGTVTTPFQIGDLQNGGYGLDGDIAELLVFNKGLTDFDRQHVEAYLYQRYGLGTAPSAIPPSLSKSPAQIYFGPQVVTLTPADNNQTLYYTTDGSDPSMSGGTRVSFTSSISLTLSSTTTLRLYTTEPGFTGTAQSLFYYFDPSSNFPRTNLVAWYRADQGVTITSGAVSKWQDQSGNGNDAAQTVTANQPTLAATGYSSTIPTIHFNGTAVTYLSAPSTAFNSNQVTVIAVACKSSNATYGPLASRLSSGGGPYYLSLSSATAGFSSPTFALTGGSVIAAATGALSNSSFGVIEGDYDQTSARIYVNGTLQQTTASTAALSPVATPLQIGELENGSYGLDGDIAELLVFNQGLSDSDRQRVEAYLYERYGLITAPTAPAPTLSVAPGLYSTSQTLTFTPVDSGQTIYYTTDGTDPSSSGTRVTVTSTTSLTISSNTNLRIYTTKAGFISNAQSLSYLIDPLSGFTRSGLVGWYRSDQGVTTSGGTVSKWQDLSGNGNDATQVVTSHQPAFVSAGFSGSIPTLRFNSTSVSYLTSSSTSFSANQVTVIAVASKTGNGTYGPLASLLTSGSGPYYLSLSAATTGSFTPTFALSGGSVFATSPPLANGPFVAVEGDYDQTSARIYVNSILSQTTPYTTALGIVSNPLQIGDLENGSYGLDGDIAELLVYNRGLTDIERGHIEAYLYSRYGLANQPTANAPLLSPGPGIYSGPQSVTLTPVDSSQTIYYTMDGSDPSNPASNRVTVTVPVSLLISASTTLRLYTTEPGCVSNAQTSAYTIDSSTNFTRTGLVAWYRADQVTSSAGSVSKWQDQSGNGNDATQTVGANQPALITNGINTTLPVVRFNNTAVTYLTAPYTTGLNANQVTVITVAKKTTSTTSNAIVSRESSGNGPYFLSISGTGTPTLGLTNGTITATGSLTANTFGVIEGDYDQTSARMYINGGLIQTTPYTTALTAATTPLQIGDLQNGASAFDGDIAEVLVFNQGLSDSDRQHVEAYLYQRYNIGTQPTATPPVLSESSQAIYSAPQIISITPADNTQTIYYTTDGTDPSSSSTRVTAAGGATSVTISSTTNLKIYTTEPGFAAKSQSVFYTIDPTSDFNHAGLIAWYRADQGVISSGGTVSNWQDQSGNGNDATQTVTTNQPAFVSNGFSTTPLIPTLHFNNTAVTYLTAPYAAFNNNQVTVVTVARKTSSTTYNAIASRISSGTGPFFLSIAGTNTPELGLTNGAITATGTLAYNTFGVIEGDYDQNSARMYINDMLTQSTPYTTALTSVTTPFQIGVDENGTYGFDGDIAELLVFNHGLNDADRQGVEGYLYKRYGLGSTLYSPANLTASFSGTQAVFNWTEQTNPISSYTLQESTDGVTWTTAASAISGSVTTYTLTGLTAGVPYSFRLLALNGNGTSAPSPLAAVVDKNLAAGWVHTLALKPDGTIWTWGANLNGQLGDGTTTGNPVPTQRMAPLPAACIQVGAGYGHSLAVDSTHKVWAWGNNSNGQLGDGTVVQRTSPVATLSVTGATAVSGGNRHSLALATSGSSTVVWAWGANDYGQLGQGNVTPLTTPALVTGLSGVTVSAIASGNLHNLLLTAGGNVMAWGDDTYGQIGNSSSSTTPVTTPTTVTIAGVPLSGVTQIATGTAHSVALKSDKTVWAWGANYNNQMGNGVSSANQTTPVQVAGLTNIVAIYAFADYTLALKNDGTIYGWGAVTLGQLGSGNYWLPTPQIINSLGGWQVLAAGGEHVVGIRSDNLYWNWGYAQATASVPNRVLSQNGQTPLPVEIPALGAAILGPEITQISGGGGSFAALDSKGNAWTWGQNSWGQAGDGTTTEHVVPSQVSSLSSVMSLAIGPDHGLAVKAGGSVWGWGDNLDSALESNSTPALNSVAPVQLAGIGNVNAVASGTNFSLYLKSDGSLWGNGDNSLGQMGTTAGGTITVPTQIPIPNLIKSVSATGSHVLALDGSGNVWAWGSNNHGQLGQGTVSTSGTPTIVPGLPVIVGIAATNSNSFAIDSSGNIWAWGANANGTLGNGNATEQHSPMEISVLLGGIAQPIKQVVGNDTFSAALTQAGAVFAWGSNLQGQFGNGSTTASLLPVQASITGKVTGLACGTMNGVALKEDGSVSIWGSTDTAELGVNVTQTNGVPVTVPGLCVNQLAPTLTSPAGTETLALGQSMVLTATPLAATGAPIAEVEFYQEGVKIGEADSAPYTQNWNPTTWGTFHLYAVTTDNHGVRSVSPLTPTTVQVPYDSDGNGLPDWWELQYFGQLGNSASAQSPAGDGYTNLQEYQLGRNPAIPQPVANFRYESGTNSSQGQQNFVISLDQVPGVSLSPTGNDAAKFPNGLPWFEKISETTGYQLAVSGTKVTYPVAFQNPVVAFGANSGAAPLYTNQSYRFGVGSGGQFQTSSFKDLKISVYAKSSFTSTSSNVSPVAVFSYTLPRVGTTDWNTFAQAGYTRTYNLSAYGLSTTLQYVTGTTGTDQWGDNIVSPFILTHTSTNSNYYFRIDYAGATVVNGLSYWMAVNDPNNWTDLGSSANPLAMEAYSLGYTLDFTDPAPWQSNYISQPQFSGQPLPPTYAGKSVDELLKVSSPVTYQFPAPTADFLSLDASPELRSHPILDKFVSDMGSNPIALTNYVLNNIQLTDAISYNDSGNISEESINPGGVNRGALATFLEKEGSPVEQCALLVYLLRKCNVSCGYVFPPHNGLLMLDSRMSSILRMQLVGAVNPDGSSSNVPTLIPVNYPWVAAYIGGQWVHIFPWLKDTSITEGYDVSGYLPTGYQTGLQWLQHYLNLDPTIRSLSTEADNPGVLYPAYIKQQLMQNHPNVSITDLGMTIFDRQNNFNSWTDFPQPWQVTSALSNSCLVSSLSGMPNIFDTIQCQVFSDQNGNGVIDANERPIIDTGAMRSLDLHDRRLMVRHVKTGVNLHTMIMSLEELRPAAGATEAFPANGAMICKQSLSTGLTSADDQMLFRITYNRHRTLPSGFTTPQEWDSFLGVSDTQQVTDVRPFRKGDTIALCLDYGRVTQEMCDAQANKYWAAQQTALANPASATDPETDQGTTLYLMGMCYYKQVSDFAAQVSALQKANIVSFFAHGFTKLSPLRNTDGTLPNNGDITLVYPSVDMAFQRLAWASNGSLQPDSGVPQIVATSDWFNLLVGEVSAQEHVTINHFFNQTNAASTVSLLAYAQQQNRPIVTLNSSNYTAMATTPYTVEGVTKTLQQWAQYSGSTSTATSTLWQSIQQTLSGPFSQNSLVYITPGPVRCSNSTYLGMGAFILSPYVDSALISGNLNGAYGTNLTFQNSFLDNLFTENSIAPAGGGYPYTWTNGVLPILTPYLVPRINFTSYQSSVAAGTFQFGLVDSANLTDMVVNRLGYPAQPNTPTGTAALVGYGASAGNTPPTASENTLGSVSRFVAEPVDVITGKFYSSKHDLHVAGPLPIDIYRNYDSLSDVDSEFGEGWRLGYFPYLCVSATGAVIYAAEKDGSVVAYRQQTSTRWTPLPADNPDLQNQWGNDSAGSIGNLFRNYIDIPTPGATTYTLHGADGSSRTFVVASYPTTGTGGVSRQRPYLQKWQDAQGNYLTFGFGSDSTQVDYGLLNRITSSNGNYVQLDYDTYGHIIEILSGDGRQLIYSYDGFGDLTSATLPDGSKTTYSYVHQTGTSGGVSGTYSQHLIKEVDSPQGRILQNVFDGNRRVIQQNSTCGSGYVPTLNATFAYTNSPNSDTTITGYTMVSDAYNRQTRYDYANSEITKITDPAPLSYTVQQTWYQPGDNSTGAYPRSLKQRIDKRGLTTNYYYDTNSNPLGQGNPTQIETVGDLVGGSTYTPSTVERYINYNTNSLPIKITDIDSTTGNYTLLDYTNGAYPYLLTGIEHWTSGGMVSETVNTYNTPSTTAPFANGMLTEVARASGSVDEADAFFYYNSSGFLTSESYASGTTDPAVSFTLVYNARGELVKSTDAAGRTTGFAYDGLGNRTWVERRDASGNLVGWNYNYFNPNGEIEWTQGSRYNPVDYAQRRYDGAGRLQELDQWRSEATPDGSWVEAATTATTKNQYDLFGDLLGITDPNGNSVLMGPAPVGGGAPSGYDAIGRPLLRYRYDSAGTLKSSESFSYEPGDKVASYTNPLGLLTTNQYTQTGQIKSRVVTNPACGSESWLYLTDGRPSVYTRADNSTWNFTYDDYNRVVTSVLKNSAGTVLKTQTQSFDRRGNPIQQSIVDESTFTFNTTYDDLDRVKTVTGPTAVTNSAQQSITNTYDAAGQVETTTNALGEATVTNLDALGRPTLVQVKNSGGTVVRSRSYSYSPDQQSTTVTDGTATGTTTTLTDFSGNPVVVQHADGTFVLSSYDRDENLLSTTDELGRTTSFSYDGLNHLAQENLPDGAPIGFSFDAVGDLLTRAMPAGLTWNATYDNASHQLSESLTQGTSTTRSSSYAYNSSGNDIGRLHTMTDPLGVVTTYSYDGFGRLSVADPGYASQGVKLKYTYDTRGLLTEIDQNYQSMAPASIYRSYNGYGALLTESTKVNGLVTSSWQQAHDGAGRRTMLKNLNISGTPTFNYTYRADDTMASTTFNGATYNYAYGTDGLLTGRTTPWKTVTVAGRDSVGRITEQTQSVGGSTVLDEKLFWRGDSTLAGYRANRTGTGTWNESRQYNYDTRGHVLSENYAPAGGSNASLAYHFDNDTPALLGLRTGVGLTGAATGSNTETYDALAHLTQQATTGTLNDPRGTPVTQTPNAMGEVTGHNPSGNTDVLTWDELGRLVKVTRRDGSNNGFNWTAYYDPFGRRTQTSTQAVVAGVNSGSAVPTNSFYDPEAEFLEVYNSAGTQNRWLVHGPDLNEQYGGLNGTGGIDAVVNYGTSATGVMSDTFGHTVATGTGSTTNWNAVRSLGYGPQPGTTPQALDATHDIASALAWRGRYIDPTGFYYLGARTYDPASGTFLSCDPLGHAASMDLYSYCNGDPVNGFDPDGRVASNYSAGWNQKIDSSTLNPDAWWSQAAFLLGSDHGGQWNGLTWNNAAKGEYGAFVDGGGDLLTAAVSLATLSTTEPYHEFRNDYDMLTYPGGMRAWSEMHHQQQRLAMAQSWNNFVDSAQTTEGAGRILTGTVSLAFASEARIASVPARVAEEPELTGVQLNKVIGDQASDAIALRYPFAIRESPMYTVGGQRILDVYVVGRSETLGIESKVGFTRLTGNRITQEVARDWWLLRSGKVDRIVWEFTRSPINGELGPDEALENTLNKLGIGIKINQ